MKDTVCSPEASSLCLLLVTHGKQKGKHLLKIKLLTKRIVSLRTATWMTSCDLGETSYSVILVAPFDEVRQDCLSIEGMANMPTYSN